MNTSTVICGHRVFIARLDSSSVDKVRPERNTAEAPAFAKLRAIAAPIPVPEPLMKIAFPIMLADARRLCNAGYVSWWKLSVKFLLVILGMIADWQVSVLFDAYKMNTSFITVIDMNFLKPA